MFTTDHPAWPAYKAALARIVDAGTRLERAQAENCTDLWKAERNFHAAIEVYAAVRLQLSGRTSPAYDGARLPQIWLGQPLLAAGTPAADADSADLEQGLG